MSSLADTHPALDFSRAWRGGALIAARTEHNVVYVGHVDYYGLACRPKGHHKAVKTCRCGCGVALPPLNGSRWLEGHRVYTPEEIERRRVAERDKQRERRATPDGRELMLGYARKWAAKKRERRRRAKLTALPYQVAA